MFIQVGNRSSNNSLTCGSCAHMSFDVMDDKYEQVDVSVVHSISNYHVECKNCGNTLTFRNVNLLRGRKVNESYVFLEREE